MIERKRDREWRNVLDVCCPKCGKVLHFTGTLYNCGVDCGFVISEEKFNELKENFSQEARTRIIGKKIDPKTGKIKFTATKVFHGERPQGLNLGF